MNSLDSIRALVFDVFGTVVDWREGVAREFAAFLKKRDVAGVDVHAMADAWPSTNSLFISISDCGDVVLATRRSQFTVITGASKAVKNDTGLVRRNCR